MHVRHSLHSWSRHLDLWLHSRDSLRVSRDSMGYSWVIRDRVIRAVRAGDNRAAVVGVIRARRVRLSRDKQFKAVPMR